MSVMNKPDYKVFAQDAKSGELVTFPNILRGWGITLEQYKGFPPMELFNSAGKRVDEWLMYLTQRGLAEWDGSVDYPKDALVQHSSVFYVALKVTKGEQPNTSQSAWKPLVDFLGVNNKLDKTAVVQSTGASTTSVMSQKSSTDTFQPKGNYADKSSSNDQIFTGSVSSLLNISSSSTNSTLALDTTKTYPRLSHRVASGAWREIKIPDRSGEMSLVGDSYTKAESDGRYQSKGDYAIAGSSYTKAESDGRYQSKGNYQPAGNYALVGESYTKVESDGKYQPKGNYADKSSSNDQIFTGSVSSLLNISSSSTNSTLALDTTKTYPRLSHRVASGAWREIKIPDRSGEMSLVGDSYTKAESDGRYQSKGDYALKSELNNIELVPHPIPWSLSTAPAGYLICQGQTFNKTTYPKLATAYPSGKLPDLRGNAIRGLDAGRGIDVDRQILSEQSGNSLLSSPIMNNPEEKGFELKINNIGTTGGDNQGWNSLYQQIEGVNGKETRMRNIAFLYIVRAA